MNKADRKKEKVRRAVLVHLTADRDQWRTEAVQAAIDRGTLIVALRDAVQFMDRLRGSKHGGEWTVKDVKRIEEIRLLSLGV